MRAVSLMSVVALAVSTFGGEAEAVPPVAASIQITAIQPWRDTVVAGEDNAILGRFAARMNVDGVLERLTVTLRGDDDGRFGGPQGLSEDLEPANYFTDCYLRVGGVIMDGPVSPTPGTRSHLDFRPNLAMTALVTEELEVQCDSFQVPLASGDADAFFASVTGAPVNVVEAVDQNGDQILPADVYLGANRAGANPFGDNGSVQLIERGLLGVRLAASSPVGTLVPAGASHVPVADLEFAAKGEGYLVSEVTLDYFGPGYLTGAVYIQYTNCEGFTLIASRAVIWGYVTFPAMRLCVLPGDPVELSVSTDLLPTGVPGDRFAFGISSTGFRAEGLTSGQVVTSPDNQVGPIILGDTFEIAP